MTAAYLTLASQSPAGDRPAQGQESAFLDDYVAGNTVAFSSGGSGTFSVPRP